MNNKELLDIILKIRSIRNDLVNLNLNDKKKEILKKSLNYYEDLLNLDITRNNHNKEEFEEQGISNDIEIVNVPLEENTNRYKEFTKVDDNELINIITSISEKFNNLNFNTNELIIILKSLKEYSEYLKQLELTKQSNQELYTEIISENGTSQK